MRPTAPELTKPLTDPIFYTGDPFPLYARLRREARFDDISTAGPVSRLESAGVVAGIVHADVVLS
jgi:hypothetical protein